MDPIYPMDNSATPTYEENNAAKAIEKYIRDLGLNPNSVMRLLGYVHKTAKQVYVPVE